MTRQIHDPFRNPFHNRFHDPVHSRLDEMQAYTQMAWLNEQAALDHEKNRTQHSHWGRALAAAFALVLVVVISATLLSN